MRRRATSRISSAPCLHLRLQSEPHRTLPLVFTSRTKWIILSVVFAMLVLAGTLWWLSWIPPRWYQPPDAHDTAANDLAALVEHRLAEEMHKIREDDSPWRLRIRDAHINAWLATRMPRWLEHERGIEWPARLGTPQVRFDHNRLSVTVPAAFDQPNNGRASRGRPMTLILTPHLRNNELHFTLTGIRVGRLPMPGDPVSYVSRIAVDRGADADDDDLTAQLIQLITGEGGLAPALKLVDNRRVVLESLRLSRGTLEVSAVTKPAARGDAE